MDGFKFGDHPHVRRYMKGIFKLGPALQRYSDIWDVKTVVDFLRGSPNIESLTMKELS